MKRSMSRKEFMGWSGKVALGAGISGAVLSGCGRSQASGEGTVAYWASMQGGQDYYRENILPSFRDTHPNVNMDVTFYSSEDLNRVVRTAIQGGEGPDLVVTSGPSYALELINADVLLELDDYAQQFNWREKMLSWALSSGEFEGSLYSMPSTYETMLLYYNQTLFEDKGWNPPENREDLESLAEEAMGQNIVPFSAGNAEWRPATEWLVTVFLNHFSGPEALYQGLRGEIPWTDAVFVDAIALLDEYFQKGWIGGGVQNYFSTGLDTLHSEFGQGAAARNMEGSWFMSEIDGFFGRAANNNNDWNWASIPSLSSESPFPTFELGIGGTISINRRAADPDAAATYLDWLVSDPNRTAGWIADVPGVFDLPIPLSDNDFPENIDERNAERFKTLSNATSEGNYGYTTWTFWPPKSNLFIYEGFERVITGKISPSEYCTELNTIFREEREAGEIPPIIDRNSA